MRKKVLILVLALDKEPFRSIETKGQRATWASSPNGDMEALWLHGKTGGLFRFIVRVVEKTLSIAKNKSALSSFRQLIGSRVTLLPVLKVKDRLMTSVPETYIHTNAKTIAGLRYVLENCEFDYLLRTNSSTYINKSLLSDYVNNLSQSTYYGGFLGKSGEDYFVSGTCILLSRDAIELICNDPAWEYDCIDDVAISRSMKRFGIKPQSFSRLDIETSEQLKAIDTQALQSAFVIRCKGLSDRDHDIAAMHRIHESILAL
jgi:hypothetical protein